MQTVSHLENPNIVSFVPKVLVVDDMQENQRAFKRILNTLGVQMFTALSGMEALALTLRHRFSVILMDVMMPEMDGLETASLLRVNEETKLVPIIFITAGDKSDSLEFKGYELGGCDYLYKPVLPAVLSGKIRVFIELEKQKHLLKNRISELDVTDKKYDLLLTVITEAVIELDSDGAICSTSPSISSLLGYDENEALTLNINQLMGTQNTESWHQSRLYQQCVVKRLVLTEQTWFIKADGSKVLLSCTAAKLSNTNNDQRLTMVLGHIEPK